jgi:hypothetical protein
VRLQVVAFLKIADIVVVNFLTVFVVNFLTESTSFLPPRRGS